MQIEIIVRRHKNTDMTINLLHGARHEWKQCQNQKHIIFSLWMIPFFSLVHSHYLHFSKWISTQWHRNIKRSWWRCIDWQLYSHLVFYLLPLFHFMFILLVSLTLFKMQQMPWQTHCIQICKRIRATNMHMYPFKCI